MTYIDAMRVKAIENELTKLRDMIKNGKDSLFWDDNTFSEREK